MRSCVVRRDWDPVDMQECREPLELNSI
jgi:hypothetical protein